jgi:uncharacterized protein YjdB
MNSMTKQNKSMIGRSGKRSVLWILLAVTLIAFLIVLHPFRTHAEEANQTVTQTKESVQNSDVADQSQAAGQSTETVRQETNQNEESVQKSTAEHQTLAAAQAPSVEYQAHVENIGWQNAVKDQAVAGTSGKSLRMEALKIQLVNNSYGGGLQYRAHVQDIGWQGMKTDGQEAGTHGRSLRIEALQLSLTGEIANHYDIYYRVHAQDIGWMGWASNGQSAGTQGYGLRLEAIQICLVAKGQPAPGSTSNAFKYKMIQASAHVQDIGWMSAVSDGALAGTTGRSLRLEALNVRLNQQDYSGSVQYQAYVENIGWQNGWSENGQTAGTTGKGLRAEGMRMQLTGDMAAHYDIYYRVHVSDIGWLGWAKNGGPAGSRDLSLRIEAFQVKLVSKRAAAPGSTKNPYLQCGLHTSVYQGGWQAEVNNGGTAGNTNSSSPIQGLKISRVDSSISGSIQYRSHISNVGWESNWTSEGNADGLPGQQNIEAIEMRLTGDMASYFDIYYSVYVKSRGWLGWAENGASAGTKGFSLPVEGVQIKLVYKGMSAPGSTADAYLDRSKMHIIVLDPGHDDYKPGASGGGLHEEKLTLKIAQYCKEELQRYGVTVYMTRESGACPGGRLNSSDCLKWRANYAASKGAEYFISLHLNSSGPSAHGCLVLRQTQSYNRNNIYSKSKNLSENILNELHGLGLPNWGTGFLEKYSGGSDPSYYPDGSLADYYGILRHGKEHGIPSVIVEHCFISNAGDRANYLSTDAKLKQLGVADAHGILKTLGLM